MEKVLEDEGYNTKGIFCKTYDETNFHTVKEVNPFSVSEGVFINFVCVYM